jgi:hypothetical protein
MSGFLRKAALVVGAVAIIAATAGLAAPAAAATATTAASAGGIAGVSAATLTAIGTYGSLAAGALSMAAAATAPGVSAQGSATSFTTNPQSGLPYAMGRTRMSGLRIYARTYDGFKQQSKDDILAFVAMLSIAGPIQGIERFTADNEVVTFASNGNAIGRFDDYMAQKVSLGPSTGPALTMTFGGKQFPGWTANHKLSGIAHAQWAMRFDTKGKLYGAGPPEPAWIGEWVKVYDPRKDSTYPGGSGSHRALNEATYEWSDNPGLHALTWALGRWQNGKRVCGIGAPVANIRVADFVECANVCDANGWKVGGVEWTTDSKWDSFKRILQAGGARPTRTGAMVGCIVNTPRTAVATIESRHLHDGLSLPTTKSRRDRFNTVIPRYVDEDSDWAVISGTEVSEPAYVATDGGQRTKEIDFPLVQVFSGEEPRQPGQLAAYAIVNSREAGPFTWTTGPEWIGLKTGDVVLLNVPEEGLVNQPVLITRRAPDPSTGKVAFAGETETFSKHAYALGQSTTPPTPFALTAPDLIPAAPEALSWSVAGTTSGEGFPALLVTGESEMPSADAIVIDYKRSADTEWSNSAILSAIAPVSHVIAPLESETAYDVRIGYRVGTIDGNQTIFANVTTGLGKVTVIEGQLAEQVDIIGQLGTDLAAAEVTIAAVQTQVDTDLAAINTEIDTINASIIDLSEEIVGISSAASPNLLDGGDFEGNFQGWDTGDGVWGVTRDKNWGTYAYRNSLADGTFVLSKTANVTAGNTYTLAADMALFASEGYACVNLVFINDAGTVLLDAPATAFPRNTDFSVTDANRKTYKCTATAPSGATKVRCRFVVASVTGLIVAAVRRMKLELGDKATAFSSEASSYTAYQTGVSNSGLIAGLNTEVNTPGGRVQQALNATTALTGSLATLTNTLQAQGNPNLIANGSFENGIGPAAAGWYSNSGAWHVATNNLWGTYAYNQAAIANGGVVYLYTDAAVAGGGTYTLTYDAAFSISGGTGSFVAQIQWLDASDALIGYADAPARAVGTFGFDTGLINRAASKFTVSAPGNTVKLRVLFYYNKTSGTVGELDLRLVKLEAGSISTAYSGDASLRQAYTVMAGMNAQLSELNTEVMTPGGRVGVLQSSMTTALGNVALLQQNVTTGSGNLLPQSSFAAPGWPAGWDWYSPAPGSYSNGDDVSRDGAGDGWRPGGNFGANQGEHNFSIHQVNGNTGDWGQLHTQRIPVQGNKWYSFELFQAAHRANCGIKIEWYTAANGFISATDAGYVTVGTGGTDINAWTNRYVKGKAPANAAFAVPVAYKGGTYAGQGDSWMWITRPMLREVTSAYVGPSAYVPSGDRASVEVIQRSVDGVVAQWGVALNVAGKIVGRVRLDGNASTSTFDVEADAMSVTKSGGGPSLTWTNGALIVNDGL